MAQPSAPPKKARFTKKQKRLLVMTAIALAVVGGSWSLYAYIAGAQERGEEQFRNAMKLMKPGNYEAAIAGFTKAIETWPQLAEAYLQRGVAQHTLGHDDEALADFERAADLNPNLARAYTARGSIYRARGDVKRAMVEFTKSISIKPNTDAFYERGQSYESLGEHQKAIEDYDRAIAEMPDAPFIYQARALAKRNLGDQAGYEADRDAGDRLEHRR
jgi:tetratricopeptide (TPR) repeat protein